MSPRPDTQGRQSQGSVPRLRPVAAPSGGGFTTGGVDAGAMASFASMSESLSNSIAQIGRAQKRREKEAEAEEYTAGRAAGAATQAGPATEAELVAQGVIPENASEAWRRGYMNIAGRRSSAKFEAQVQEWMQRSLSPENLFDENGAPKAYNDPLEDLGRLQQQFRSQNPLFANPDFSEGFDNQAIPIIEQTAAKYRDLRNKAEVTAIESLVTSESSNAISSAFEASGGVLTPDIASQLVEYSKSLSTGYGIPLSKRNPELLFSALQQFVTEAAADEDIDLDEVGAFVQQVVEMPGMNGTSSFLDDDEFSSDALKLLDSLDSRADAQASRNRREKQEREEKYTVNMYRDYGGLSADEIIALRTDLAKGEGRFANLDPEERDFYLTQWSTLRNDADTRATITDKARARASDQVEIQLRSGQFESFADWKAHVLSIEGVDKASLLKLGDDYFDEVRTEERADRAEARQEEADRRAKESDRRTRVAGYEDQASGVEDSWTSYISNIPLGERGPARDELESIKLEFQRELDRLSRADATDEQMVQAVDRYNQKVREKLATYGESFRETGAKKASVADYIGTGDFASARSTLEELNRTGLSAPEEYAAQLDDLDRQEERYLETLRLDGRGVVGEYGSLIQLIGDELDSETLRSLFPEDTPFTKDPANYFKEIYRRALQEDAENWAEQNRGKYKSNAAFEDGLSEYLGSTVEEWFQQAGGKDQAAAAKILQLVRESRGGLIEFQTQMERRHRLENMGAAAEQPGGLIGNSQGDVRSAAERVSVAIRESKAAPSRTFEMKLAQGPAIDVPFDPLAAEGEEGAARVLTAADRVRTNEYLFVTDRVDTGLAVTDFRTAGRGFSVEEVLSGKTTVGLTDNQREQLKRNRDRITGYSGTRGDIPTEDVFLRDGDDVRMNFGHVITFGSFMTEENFGKVKSRAAEHYDRMIALPDVEIEIDQAEIANRAAALNGEGQGLLVFGSQEEIEAFRANPAEHPYFSLFELNDETAQSFLRVQDRLLAQKSADGLLEQPYVAPEPVAPYEPQPQDAAELQRQAAEIDAGRAESDMQAQAELERDDRAQKQFQAIKRRFDEAVAAEMAMDENLAESERAALREAEEPPVGRTTQFDRASSAVPPVGRERGATTEEFLRTMGIVYGRADQAQRARLREMLPDMKDQLDRLKGRITDEDYKELERRYEAARKAVGGDSQ